MKVHLFMKELPGSLRRGLWIMEEGGSGVFLHGDINTAEEPTLTIGQLLDLTESEDIRIRVQRINTETFFQEMKNWEVARRAFSKYLRNHEVVT